MGIRLAVVLKVETPDESASDAADSAAPETAPPVIVRWMFTGWIGVGMVDYMIPTNETAAIGMSRGGRAHTLIDLGWKLPLPNRPFRYVKQGLLAAQWYGFGRAAIVSYNPLAWLLLWLVLTRDPALAEVLTMTRSLDAGRNWLRSGS